MAPRKKKSDLHLANEADAVEIPVASADQLRAYDAARLTIGVAGVTLAKQLPDLAQIAGDAQHPLAAAMLARPGYLVNLLTAASAQHQIIADALADLAAIAATLKAD